MGHSHGHGHAHAGAAVAPAGRDAHRRRLWAVLALSSTTMVAEVVAAAISGSVALLADAAHMLTDVIAVGAAIAAITLAANVTTRRSSYGLHRVEIVVAALNALLLLAVFAFVAWAAAGRLRHPTSVASGWMIGAAGLGLVVNAVGLWVLRDQQHESLNVRGVYLEILGDLIGSAAVVVAGVLIALGASDRFDPIASLVVAVLIVPRTFGLLRDAAGCCWRLPRGTSTSTASATTSSARRASWRFTTCTYGRSRRACPR